MAELLGILAVKIVATAVVLGLYGYYFVKRTDREVVELDKKFRQMLEERELRFQREMMDNYPDSCAGSYRKIPRGEDGFLNLDYKCPECGQRTGQVAVWEDGRVAYVIVSRHWKEVSRA